MWRAHQIDPEEVPDLAATVLQKLASNVWTMAGLFAAAAALVLASCTAHSIRIVVSNMSNGDVYVRAHWDHGEVHVLRSPATTQQDMLAGQVGELDAAIEVLRPDCSMIASWRGPAGGMITIGTGGSAEFGAIPDEQPGLEEMQEVAACSSTQFPAGPATPTVTPSGG